MPEQNCVIFHFAAKRRAILRQNTTHFAAKCNAICRKTQCDLPQIATQNRIHSGAKAGVFSANGHFFGDKRLFFQNKIW